MWKKVLSALILGVSLIALAALPSAGTPSADDGTIASNEGGTPTKHVADSMPMHVTLEIDRAPALGEIANVTASVTADVPAPGTTLQIDVPPGAEVVAGETTWAGDLEVGEQGDLAFSLRFVEEGNWAIAATALSPIDEQNTLGDVAQVFFNVKSDAGQFDFDDSLSPADGELVPTSGDEAVPDPAAESLPSSSGRPLPSISEEELPASADPDEVAPDSAAGVDENPGSVTVWGYVYYYGRDGVQHPLANFPVELWDADSTSADDYLGYDYSDASGYYSIGPVSNDDCWLCGTLDVYIRLETETNKYRVKEQTWWFPDEYAWSSESCCEQSNVPDGTIQHPNVSVPWNDADRGAVWIFQSLQDAWLYPPNDPGDVTVRWDSDGTEGDYYSRGGDVWLEANTACSRDIAVHEAGHNYMYNAYANWNWDSYCPSPHYFCGDSHVNCAWSEGWADFMPLAVYPDQSYNWAGAYYPSGGACGSGSSINVETAPGWCDDGDDVEGRVAGALLDLKDSNNDGDDHYNGGFSPIWDTFFNQDDVTFSNYWSAWKSRGHNKHDAVQAVFQNTIDYDTAPTLTGIPNRTLNEDASWNNALDLWVYASDPESTDGQLAYSITANTNPDCGVSIDGLDYVDIDPTADWCGFCDVTVEADDGVKTDTDVFRVNVTCINDAPEISGLPDRTLDQDTSLNDTISLSTFASDVEEWSLFLTYTKTGDTNPDVGVSIDWVQIWIFWYPYIDINPTPGWCGESDVTIRVTDDGSLWDEDTFHVTVNCTGGPAEGSPISSVTVGTDVYAFGRDSGDSYWYRRWNGTSWDGWTGLGGTLSTAPSAVAAGADVYVFGLDAGGGLWYRRRSGGTWGGWQGLGGVLSGQVSAAATASNNVYVFARDASGGYWYRHWNGTSWEAWSGLGGVLSTSPSATSAGADVYVFGLDASGGPWYQRRSGGTWSGWQGLGGVLSGQVSAAATASNNAYVFGRDSGGSYWYRRWNGASWEAWSGLGGTLSSSPSAVAAGADIYVSGLDASGSLWYQRRSGGTWGGWQGLGGGLTGTPSAAAPGANDVYIFGLGGDSALWYRHRDAVSFGAWQGLGGVLVP